MKKLLQINTVGNWGSTGKIAEEIGKHAVENGWESYFSYGRYNRPSKSKTIKIGSKASIMFHLLLTRLFDKHGYGSRRATKKLVREIENIKPDLIHLHNLHGYYLNIGLLFTFLSSKNIPIVWTLHDCWAITGHCTHFDLIGCEKWKKECSNCPQKRLYPGSLVFDNSKQNHKLKKRLFGAVKNMTIVPVSNWLSEIITESHLKKYPKKVIHNGIDTNIFVPINDSKKTRERYSIGDRFMMLGVASRWYKEKGLKDFINLAQKISDEYIIVLVGLAEQQIDDLPGNIIGIKRTESVKELIELYSTADLYVNPTWEDNFPTTNIEALACGTPIITYRTGGSIEAVDNATGFIVDQGDIDGIINIAKEVKRKGKTYYSNYCRIRAKELFNKEERYAEYLELYNDLIKKQTNV